MIDLDKVQPLGPRLLVRRYTLPETIRGIIIPENHRHDKTVSLWELVKATPEAETFVGQSLEEGDLIQTRPYRGLQVPDHEDHFILMAHEILNVVKW